MITLGVGHEVTVGMRIGQCSIFKKGGVGIYIVDFRRVDSFSGRHQVIEHGDAHLGYGESEVGLDFRA